jgi:hypothetical protein
VVKYPIYGPENGFILLPAPRKPRLGMARLFEHLTGSVFDPPSFQLRHEGQLPAVMSERVDVTVSKVMNAVAQCYVEGFDFPLLCAEAGRGLVPSQVLSAGRAEFPSLYVEGARVQHGTGTSSREELGGKTYLLGTEAAHYGIGTLTLQGEAVSIQGGRQLFRLANRLGLSRKDIPEVFEASGLLVSRGLVCDGATFEAPAFFNQVEGLLEREQQMYLRSLVPTAIPKDAGGLEHLLGVLGDLVVHALTADRAVVRPIEDRLLALQRGQADGYRQHPDDVENQLFGGDESELLEEKKAEYQDADSRFYDLIEQIRQAIPRKAREEAELAEASKEERAAAQGGGQPGAGGEEKG